MAGREVAITVTMVPHATFGHVAKISVTGLPDVYATPMVNVHIHGAKAYAGAGIRRGVNTEIKSSVGADEEI
jgi:hypothetical protein